MKSVRFATPLALISMVALGLAGARPVHADTITFSSDTTGPKPNGFQSVDSPLVRFSDSIGTDLTIRDFGVQSHGQALGVLSDSPSQLIMDFTTPVNSLSLAFGNDDPRFTVPGDLAMLTAYLGGNPVQVSTVTMNRDDIMNQSISVGGVVFDRAAFVYAHADNTPEDLAEVVDDINFTPVPGVVPEPASLTVLAAGVLPLLRRRRRSLTPATA